MSAVMETKDTTLNDLFNLSVGDVVEAPSLMPGITTESCVLQVTQVQKEEGVTKGVMFRMTFYGVTLSFAFLSVTNDGEFLWTYL